MSNTPTWNVDRSIMSRFFSKGSCTNGIARCVGFPFIYAGRPVNGCRKTAWTALPGQATSSDVSSRGFVIVSVLSC